MLRKSHASSQLLLQAPTEYGLEVEHGISSPVATVETPPPEAYVSDGQMLWPVAPFGEQLPPMEAQYPLEALIQKLAPATALYLPLGQIVHVIEGAGPDCK